MTLNSLISSNQILLDIESTDLGDVISEMVSFAATLTGADSELANNWEASFLQREKEFSTGIGNGVAIPHAFCDHIEDTVIVMGRSKVGVDFESLDNQPVNVVVLFVSPRQEFQKHLHVLAAIGKSFRHPELVESIVSSKSADEVLAAIKYKG